MEFATLLLGSLFDSLTKAEIEKATIHAESSTQQTKLICNKDMIVTALYCITIVSTGNIMIKSLLNKGGV